MKKLNRKSRAVLSGLMVGLASIYAVASYFDLGMAELNAFLLSTLVFFVGIVLLALLAVTMLKLVGALLRRLRGESGDDSGNAE